MKFGYMLSILSKLVDILNGFTVYGWIITFITSIVMFFVPISFYICIIFGFALMDMLIGTGISIYKKEFKSKIFKKGLLEKLVLYGILIIVFLCLDLLFMNVFSFVVFYFTIFITILVGIYETISIIESLEKFAPNNKIIGFMKRILDFAIKKFEKKVENKIENTLDTFIPTDDKENEPI